MNHYIETYMYLHVHIFLKLGKFPKFPIERFTQRHLGNKTNIRKFFLFRAHGSAAMLKFATIQGF